MVATISGPCLAQDDPVALPQPVIEEIVVTAQKRERAAQDVPISMSAFTGSDLQELDLDHLAQVADYSPNVQWDPSFLGAANLSSLFIRGVGQSASFSESNADPAVGLYLDGVYVGRAVGSVPAVLDIERVEILRGPQGTLFGKNATGGAVTLTTARPTPGFHGRAEVTAGRFDRIDMEMVINAPVSERLLTRWAASTRNRDGYGVSLQDGTEFGDTNADHIRGSVRWLPGENLVFDLIADASRVRQSAASTTLVFADADPQSLTGAYNFFVAPANAVPGFGEGVGWDGRFLTGDAFSNYSTADSGSDLDAWGVTALLDWRSDPLQFKSVTAYRDLNSDWAVDADLSPLTIVEDVLGTDQHQFSQELNLRGLHGPLDWLVGLYYFEERSTASGGVIIIPEVVETPIDPLFGIPNPLFGVPLSQGILPAIHTSDVENTAVFGHLEYALSEKLLAAVGLRFTRERKRIDNPPNVGVVASDGDTATFDDLSPTLGVQYFVEPDLQIYASASRGFKSGGFNALVLIPRSNYLPFEPEHVDAVELGLKLRRDRLWVAAALFSLDYQDIHVSVLNGVEPQILNAAEARIEGAEAELAAAISPSLRLQASAGYLDARYTRLDELGLQGLTVPVNLRSRFMNAPRWSGSLGLRYSRIVSRAGTLDIRGDLTWQDRTFNDAINTPELVQEAFALLHASASLTSRDERWTLSLFGNNLSDEHFIQSGLANKPEFGLVIANYAPPRSWGLRVSLRF